MVTRPAIVTVARALSAAVAGTGNGGAPCARAGWATMTAHKRLKTVRRRQVRCVGVTPWGDKWNGTQLMVEIDVSPTCSPVARPRGASGSQYRHHSGEAEVAGVVSRVYAR